MSAIIFHVNFCVFMALFMEFCYNSQARIEKENNNVKPQRFSTFMGLSPTI